MLALIFKNKVVQIEDVQFPVHSSLVWIDITGVSPTPTVGWSYDGVNFSSPPPPPTPPTDNKIYDRTIRSDKVLKAIVLALNDSSFVPGSNYSNASLKNIIRSKM